METSRLSLKKVNNIARQCSLHEMSTADIVKCADGAMQLNFENGISSAILRDFYEFYVDDRPLISIIGDSYWTVEADVDSAFFNTHVGCLGSLGAFWDGIFIRILLKKDLTAVQEQHLFKQLKGNFLDKESTYSEEEAKRKILQDTVEGFLFYCCQTCGDTGCGGLTLTIIKADDHFIWTDEDKIMIRFDAMQYESVFRDYLNSHCG